MSKIKVENLTSFIGNPFELFFNLEIVNYALGLVVIALVFYVLGELIGLIHIFGIVLLGFPF